MTASFATGQHFGAVSRGTGLIVDDMAYSVCREALIGHVDNDHSGTDPSLESGSYKMWEERRDLKL